MRPAVEPSDSEQRVALVTGAGGRWGRALALELASRGYAVAAQDRTPVYLDRTVGEIQADGGQARAFITEVTKGLPVGSLVDEVLEEWGRIDVLVNSLWVEPQTPLLNMDEWDWQHTLDVNLNGPFLLMQAAGRVMQDQGGGLIINLLLPAEQPQLGQAALFVSQAARTALTESAAQEFLAYNIRVESFCPQATGDPRSESRQLIASILA